MSCPASVGAAAGALCKTPMACTLFCTGADAGAGGGAGVGVTAVAETDMAVALSRAFFLTSNSAVFHASVSLANSSGIEVILLLNCIPGVTRVGTLLSLWDPRPRPLLPPLPLRPHLPLQPMARVMEVIWFICWEAARLSFFLSSFVDASFTMANQMDHVNFAIPTPLALCHASMVVSVVSMLERIVSNSLKCHESLVQP
jgi:hypothetical protein